GFPRSARTCSCTAATTVTPSGSTASTCSTNASASSTRRCRWTTSTRAPSAGWTRSAEELPRVHDPGGVEFALHGAQRVDPGGADLVLQPRRMVDADGMVMRDRASAGEDHLHGCAF